MTPQSPATQPQTLSLAEQSLLPLWRCPEISRTGLGAPGNDVLLHGTPWDLETAPEEDPALPLTEKGSEILPEPPKCTELPCARHRANGPHLHLHPHLEPEGIGHLCLSSSPLSTPNKNDALRG